MADTLVLRLDIERGMYANFPENFKSYTEVKAIAGIVDSTQATEEDGLRPVLHTIDGAVARASGTGETDRYVIERIGVGMFADNVAGAEEVTSAVDGLLKGRDGKLQDIQRATFVGQEAIANAVEALGTSEHFDAVLLRQLSLLAVNYAQRDVQDTVDPRSAY